MNSIRAIIKLIAFWLWALGLFFGGKLVALFLPARQYWRWRGFLFGLWARGAARLLGMRIQANGAPPPAPCLLVSNHLSYVDIIALLTQMDCTFVAKSEVSGWPVVGYLCRGMNIVFVNRKQHRDLARAMGAMQEMLNNGVSVIFFPEGTSTNGDNVAEFKPSLLELAAQQNRPVHYAALHYTTPDNAPPARDTVCWWGAMTFSDHFFNLLKLRRFNLHLSFGPQPVQSSERKELAQQLWTQVSAELAQIRSAPKVIAATSGELEEAISL